MDEYDNHSHDELVALVRGLEAALEAERGRADHLRDILRRKGYRERCDIPACNCGEHEWNHGGHASDRLREICNELSSEMQGRTVLDAVRFVLSERDAALAKKGGE